MVKGDVVLITFPFTDLTGSKLRPTVVLANSELDVTVCFITAQLQWQEQTDIQLLPTSSNGLRKEISNKNKQNCNIRKNANQEAFMAVDRQLMKLMG